MGVGWASAVCEGKKKREKEVEKWKRAMEDKDVEGTDGRR